MHARLEQRRRDRGARGLACAAIASGLANTHQGGARIAHDRANVGKVEVDQAGNRDQVGDALDALAQHVVGHLEGVNNRGAALDQVEQAIVWNHDDRVDMCCELFDSTVGLLGAASTFEAEGTRDNTNRECSEFACDLGNHRSGACTRAATLAGSHEHHVGSAKGLLDLFLALNGGLATDIGVRAGAKAARNLSTELNLDVGVRHQECLCVRVGGDELYATQARVNHAIDRVAAAAADADDLDHCQICPATVSHCHDRPPLSLYVYVR